MSRIVFPPRDLPGRAEVWGRAVEGELGITHEDVVQLRQVVTNGLRATSGQLETMAQTLNQVVEQQSRLANAGEVSENVATTVSNGDVWYPSPPEVTMSSLSGRFEVSIFGTSTGAMSFYSFTAPGYPLSRITGSGANESERVSGAGGASSAFTVYGSWIVTPTAAPGTPVTFTAQARGTTAYSSTTSLKIRVRPVL